MEVLSTPLFLLTFTGIKLGDLFGISKLRSSSEVRILLQVLYAQGSLLTTPLPWHLYSWYRRTRSHTVNQRLCQVFCLHSSFGQYHPGMCALGIRPKNFSYRGRLPFARLRSFGEGIWLLINFGIMRMKIVFFEHLSLEQCQKFTISFCLCLS